jgi:hypothetical protein
MAADEMRFKAINDLFANFLFGEIDPPVAVSYSCFADLRHQLRDHGARQFGLVLILPDSVEEVATRLFVEDLVRSRCAAFYCLGNGAPRLEDDVDSAIVEYENIAECDAPTRCHGTMLTLSTTPIDDEAVADAVSTMLLLMGDKQGPIIVARPTPG